MGTLHWGGAGGGLAKPGSYILYISDNLYLIYDIVQIDEMLDHKTFHFQRHLPSRGQTTELRQESNQSNAGDVACRIDLVMV